MGASTDLTDLTDRVAIVTGASSGIGAATTRVLAREGMRVAACARRLDRLERLRDELGEDRVRPVQVDLRDEAQILGLFETVRRKWGGLDVLVNNAGLGRFAPLVDGDTAKWKEMLDVNVLGLCMCTREAVRDMRARDAAGHVVHIGSMGGHRVPTGGGVYSATKFAVRALTEGLRQELRALGSPIRVTSISPGFVETEFAFNFTGSEEAATKTYSQFEVLKSEDVASAVLYAISRPPHMQVHDLLVRPTDQPS